MIALTTVPKMYFVHTDHLNTPRLIASDTGQAVWQWNNDDPYGNNAPNENPSSAGQFTFNLRFPGQYFDSETSTHYNYFRDYDASTGRYAQSDPIGLIGGINTYAYVDGNPIGYIDPEGLLFTTTLYGMRNDMSTDDAVRAGGPGTIAAGIANAGLYGGVATTGGAIATAAAIPVASSALSAASTQLQPYVVPSVLAISAIVRSGNPGIVTKVPTLPTQSIAAVTRTINQSQKAGAALKRALGAAAAGGSGKAGAFGTDDFGGLYCR